MNAQKLEQAEKTASDFINRIQEQTKAWEADGRDAWTALKRLRGTNLADGDEIIIARRLHREIQALKVQLKRNGLGLGKFAIDAGLGTEGEYSKELYRMTLAPDKDPAKVRLRKSAAKYLNLIAAIARQTRESTGSLANRLLLGTSLHPAEAKDWDEVEQVQVALQAIVDRVDRDFRLYATYMETAEIKATHAKSGGKLRWPQHEHEYRAIYFAQEGETLMSLIDGVLQPEFVRAVYQREIKDACDARHAYWMQDTGLNRSPYFWWPLANGSGCLQDDDYFYVPHVHLGFIEMFNIPDPDENQAVAEQELSPYIISARNEFVEFGEVPCDDWDEAHLRPTGQTTSLGSSTLYHGWIVIYPTPDNLRLMPMLYISHEEGGPYLLPLDAGNLNILRKSYWISSREVMSVFDRIKELIGYVPGTQQVIMESFRRTAPWLQHNPILKLNDASIEDRQLLEDYCKRLWNADQLEGEE